MKTVFLINLILLLILLIGYISINTLNETTGTVKNIEYTNNKITITLKENDIKILVFDSINIKINNNDKIHAIGKLQNYKLTQQFVAEKITKIGQ